MSQSWNKTKTVAVVGGAVCGLIGGPLLMVAAAGYIWSTFKTEPKGKSESEVKRKKEVKAAWKTGALVAAGTLIGGNALLALATGAAGMGIGGLGGLASIAGGCLIAGIATKGLYDRIMEQRKAKNAEAEKAESNIEMAAGPAPGK